MVDVGLVEGLAPLTLRDEAYLRLMRLIEQNPDSTQRELAQAVGMGLRKAHYIMSSFAG